MGHGSGYGTLVQPAGAAHPESGLVPVALGLMPASGAVTAQAADDTLLTAAISGATVAFVLLSRWNPLWMMAIGAAATMAL